MHLIFKGLIFTNLFHGKFFPNYHMYRFGQHANFQQNFQTKKIMSTKCIILSQA